MKFFITLTKRHLIIITALIIIALLVSGSVYSAKTNRIDGSTNALRVAFVKSLGYDIDETAVYTKEITIPQKFGKVYKNYNELQKAAGFDLSDHKGKKATLYCYKLSFDEQTVVNLLVADGQIIGGDVANVRLDGEMKPLKDILS